jgi:hypothetical protein
LADKLRESKDVGKTAYRTLQWKTTRKIKGKRNIKPKPTLLIKLSEHRLKTDSGRHLSNALYGALRVLLLLLLLLLLLVVLLENGN